MDQSAYKFGRWTQVVAIALTLLLAFGGRATAVINQYLNIIPLPMTPQGPVEEEEERHGKAASKSAATERRSRDDVPTPGAGTLYGRLANLAAAPTGVFKSVRVRPDCEADFRNGLGAPLRC